MLNINQVTLGGYVTRDPELSYATNGRPQCKTSLAITTRRTGTDGGRIEKTTFVEIRAFGQTAEQMARFLKKGDPSLIEGELYLHNWEDEGEKRNRLQVTVKTLHLLPTKRQLTENAKEPEPQTAESVA